MINQTILEQEADIFFRYLTKKGPDQNITQQYINGVLILELNVLKSEEKIYKHVLKNKKMSSFIDYGLHMYHPTGNIRRKILLMASLIESDKTYFSYFYNENQIQASLIKFTFLAVKISIHLVFVKLLFRFKRWN